MLPTTEFLKLTKPIKKYLALIHNTLGHGLSNALPEATNTNTHLRLLTRHAYGYHSTDALVTIDTPHPRRTLAHHCQDDHETDPRERQ
jgi:hypothetical protein